MPPSKTPITRAKRSSEPIVTYRLSRMKVWPLLVVALVMFAVGLWRLVDTGGATRDDLIGGIVFILLGAYLSVDMVRVLRLPEPILTLSRDGILDRRRGTETIRWDAIESAELKRLILARALRLQLTDGRRVDIDLSMLDASPRELMETVQTSLSQGEIDTLISDACAGVVP